MKRNLITLGVALLILAGIVFLNRMSPDRLAEAQQEASQEAAEQVERADILERQLAQNTETEDEPEEKADTVSTETYKVKLETTEGDVVIAVHPDWAPLGAARFKEAVEAGVYNDATLFRVVPGFVVQFGIPGDPKEAAKWRDNTIKDDAVTQSNKRGTITFATAGPNSRTTQVFINLGNNANLDSMGFAPFGEVVEGMDVVEKFNSEYADRPTSTQMQIQTQGNAFLDKQFPGLDKIENAEVMSE